MATSVSIKMSFNNCYWCIFVNEFMDVAEMVLKAFLRIRPFLSIKTFLKDILQILKMILNNSTRWEKTTQHDFYYALSK